MSDARADFAAVYANHGEQVYRFALYLCGELAEAEDIAAETFARAWTSPTPLVNDTVRSYLFTIARNVHRQRARSNDRLDPLTETLAAHRGDDIVAREELRSVHARLRKMSPDDRAALLMRADGISYDEIAAALGTSPAAARVRVHRVRAILTRARLGGTEP